MSIENVHRYKVEIHGFGTAQVNAAKEKQVRWMMVQFLRANGQPQTPFMQPMEIRRMYGPAMPWKTGVVRWQAWDEDEPQDVSNFRLVSV